MMQGRQQQIVAHSMNGMAYPMQLKVRNTMDNLQETQESLDDSKTNRLLNTLSLRGTYTI